MVPETGGSVPRNEIDVQLAQPRTLRSGKELIGDTAQGWECFQTFEPALPYTPFFPFIPKWFFLLSGRHPIPLLSRYVVRRQVSAVYVNDFNQDNPCYQLTASDYPQHNISVRIHFISGNHPTREQISARIIQQNGVHQVGVVEPTGEPSAIYDVKVPLLMPGTRLRISWPQL